MTIPVHNWVFPARLMKIVDADTQDYLIDQGMHGQRIERIRLMGVNAPEVRGITKVAGDIATAYVRQWMPSSQENWPLVLQTFKSDDFGRYLAVVWRTNDGACLNDDLLSSGNAVVYPSK